MLHKNCIDRLQKVRNIHHDITEIMNPLATKACVGIFCRRREEYYIHLRIDIVSYCADLTEKKDPLEVKHSNSTMQRCPRSHAKRNDEAFFRDSRSRTMGETKKILYEYHRRIKLYIEMKHSRPTEVGMDKG